MNPNWKQGQLSSIQAAIRSLPEGQTDGMMLFLVDHPLVSAAIVGEIVAQFYESGRPIVLPKFRGKRGHPVIFARRLYDELLAPRRPRCAGVVWAHAGGSAGSAHGGRRRGAESERSGSAAARAGGFVASRSDGVTTVVR